MKLTHSDPSTIILRRDALLWLQKPYVVCSGNEAVAATIATMDIDVLQDATSSRTQARRIIWDTLYHISRQPYPGCAYMLSSYVTSLLARQMGDKLNWEMISRNGRCSEALIQLMGHWSNAVFASISRYANDRLVHEVSKSEGCWDHVISHGCKNNFH